MRKGVKPVSTPQIGSFWRSNKYHKSGVVEHSIVAVLNVKSGYARMGMRTDIVEYTSAVAFAVNDSVTQRRDLRTLAREVFLESYSKIEDEEELSSILGMMALKYYA